MGSDICYTLRQTIYFYTKKIIGLRWTNKLKEKSDKTKIFFILKNSAYMIIFKELWRDIKKMVVNKL